MHTISGHAKLLVKSPAAQQLGLEILDAMQGEDSVVKQSERKRRGRRKEEERGKKEASKLWKPRCGAFLSASDDDLESFLFVCLCVLVGFVAACLLLPVLFFLRLPACTFLFFEGLLSAELFGGAVFCSFMDIFL